jgi:hypothetical protein
MSTPGAPGYPGDAQQHPPGVAPGTPAGGYGGAQTGYPDPGPPAGYQPQGYGQPAGQGPGMGERAHEVAERVARHVKTPETKEFFKTSEFGVWALTVLGILISAAVVTEGSGHDFPANLAWLYVAIVSAAYIVSRGIAKAGTRRGYGDAPFDRADAPTASYGAPAGAPFQRGGGY